MSVVGVAHERWVFGRRVRVLSELLAPLLPAGARVLDVGCGNGLVARSIMGLRPDTEIRGADVLVREGAHIPVEAYDGLSLRYDDDAFDALLLVDVLHHTTEPKAVLREAARVAARSIVLKDHLLEGFLAGPTLRFMDWVGNAHHRVSLPYNYWRRELWQDTFDALGLRTERWSEDVPLYPPPASWVFGRSLHFVARLSVGPG